MQALFSFGTSAWLAAVLVAAVGSISYVKHDASKPCAFDVIDTTMYLKGHCTTDSTIVVPDAMTLNGRGHTIYVRDPDGGSFKGAVISNQGEEAHVVHLTIDAANLADACDTGDDRLRGVLLEGAHGTVKHVTISGLHQGASSCLEGVGIEARNAPFDGTGTKPMNVEIEHNRIIGYQKGGIVVNGNVWALIGYNEVGASATQQQLVANGIQLGFGASGDIIHNDVAGNQWCGAGDLAATAILALATKGEVNIGRNKVDGNADVGVHAYNSDITVSHNHITDDPFVADCNQYGYDIGVGSFDGETAVEKNIIKNFTLPLDMHTESDESSVDQFGALPSPFL